MNLNEQELVESNMVNVVSLFKESKQVLVDGHLDNLIEEAMIEEDILIPEETREAPMVSEDQFPDQSMFILDEQLAQLKSSLNRIKFYLGELDDVIPR